MACGAIAATSPTPKWVSFSEPMVTKTETRPKIITDERERIVHFYTVNDFRRFRREVRDESHCERQLLTMCRDICASFVAATTDAEDDEDYVQCRSITFNNVSMFIVYSHFLLLFFLLDYQVEEAAVKVKRTSVRLEIFDHLLDFCLGNIRMEVDIKTGECLLVAH